MLIIAFRSGPGDRAEGERPTGLRKRGGTGASTCRRTIERIKLSSCSVRFRQRCGSAQNPAPHCGRARRVSRAGPRRRRTRRGAGRARGRRPGAGWRSGSGPGGAQGDFHGGGLEVFANAFELGHQPPTPALLIAERLAVSQGFELLDQLLAVDEESSAGLVAAEAVQQLDGLDRRLRPKSFSMVARSRTGTGSRRSSSMMRGR